MGASFSINGMRIDLRGDRLFVDGVQWGPLEPGAPTPDLKPPTYTLHLDQDGCITGDIKGNLMVEGSGTVHLKVQGQVRGSVSVEHGSVVCGSNVGGSVQAGEDVHCSNVGGSAQAGRNIEIRGSVGGSVRAGRDVRRS